MATVPAPLKAADVHRFALRAIQLEKIKPAVSYWLTLYIVEIILKNGLEKTDQECMLYTVEMMDKLEHWKTELADDQAIHDDMAAQAYMEQFALDTFERADKSMRARKTTVQTADTFQAARTFLDLMTIWQKPLNPEVASKSKYAKYHAVRILKAIKAGEDPNLEEEEQEPPPESPPPLDPNDPEVLKINSLQPTVEDVDDQPSPSYQDTHTIPTAPSDVSPMEQDPSTSSGGYFANASASPTVPTFTADETSPSLTTAAPGSPMDTTSATTPTDFYTQQPPMIPPSVPLDPPTAPLNHVQARAASQFQTPPPVIPQFNAAPAPPPPLGPQYSSVPAVPIPAGGVETYLNDDEAIIAAIKHGKWALSALNFDDVETAVKEFRIALQSLGAR